MVNIAVNRLSGVSGVEDTEYLIVPEYLKTAVCRLPDNSRTVGNLSKEIGQKSDRNSDCGGEKAVL